jgi:hypothetical protein
MYLCVLIFSIDGTYLNFEFKLYKVDNEGKKKTLQGE